MTRNELSLPLLANDLRLACQRLARRVRFEGTHEVAPHQFSALVRVRSQHRTPTELAEMERISTPAVTRTLNCLEGEGYIRRTQHPDDGRQVLVQITPKGTALVEKVFADRDTWMMQHLEGLGPDQLDVLRQAADILLEVAARD